MSVIEPTNDALRRTRPLAAAAAAVLLGLYAPATGAQAEGRQADSDDYVCNHGAPDDPATIDACGRLRGTTQGMTREVGLQRDNDDYNCTHGAPGDPVTQGACMRLRGTPYATLRDEGHQRDNDDWVCHHGAPDDPATQQACDHLHGYAGHFTVIHYMRDYPAPRRTAKGHSYLSTRYTIELNCEAGVRRRIAVERYAGHHGSGGRVEGWRSVGDWRPAGAACEAAA
jgi:hypothetical protein